VIDESQLSAVERASVYGSDGEKIGKVGQVYLDDETGRPEWVSVNTGLFGLNESLVPLRDATFTGDRLEVGYDKDTVKGAPRVEADRHLDAGEEEELYRYYGLAYTAAGDYSAASGTRVGDIGTGAAVGGTSDADDTTRTDAGTGYVAAGGGRRGSYLEGEGTYDTTPTVDREDELTVRTSDSADSPVSRGTSDFAAPTGAVDDITRTGTATGTDRDWTPGTSTTGAATREPSAGSADDAMTRSEEELRVGTEKVERGRARLRKYVTTEEQTVTVPVTREEVRVEREPITDANRGDAVSGPDITESEHDVVLHEERPVVATEVRPVERVRLEKETVTDEQQVSGEVRKEHIDFEDESGTRRP
jgi:uncharacterized protein (TIGR02271 family)